MSLRADGICRVKRFQIPRQSKKREAVYHCNANDLEHSLPPEDEADGKDKLPALGQMLKAGLLTG